MANAKVDAILKQLADMTPKSGAYWEKAKDLVPGGLMSGARSMKPYPVYLERAKGAYLYDIDGNKYIDNICSFGVHFLGHGPDYVLEALREQMEKGMSFASPHTKEIEFTERLIDASPCAEMAMVTNTGTEATLLAWRLMRAATGRNKIAKFEGCYHGWHDFAQWSIFADPEKCGPADRPNAVPTCSGLPQGAKDSLVMLPMNENAFDIIEENAADLAGVAFEGVLGGGILKMDPEFLKKLREVTQKHGILLHMDEVITGFRVALGGCQELLDFVPDIATYGKIMGGGLPIGALTCGKALVETAQKTDDGFAAAGTFSGNPMSLTAGTVSMKWLAENRHVYDEAMQKGDFLVNGFNSWCQEKGYDFCMTGVGSMFQIHAKKEQPKVPRDMWGQDEDALHDLQLFYRLNGILLPWMHIAFFGVEHTQADIEHMLNTFKLSVEGVLDLRS